MGIVTCIGLLALSAPTRAARSGRSRSGPAKIAAQPSPYAAEIEAALADVRGTFAVPEALVRAVIQQESAFDPRAVSRTGARGLMQLMPATARAVGVAPEQLFSPGPNILAGTRLLAVLLRHYRGDLVSTLVAYNSGPKSEGRIPSNGETPAYVYDVIALYVARRGLAPVESARGATPGGPGCTAKNQAGTCLPCPDRSSTSNGEPRCSLPKHDPSGPRRQR